MTTDAIDNLNADIKKLQDIVTSFAFAMHTGGFTPVIQDITLSGSSFNGGSPSGTVVGNIAVVIQPNGTTFNGTLGLSGTDAGKFQIVGSQLQTNGVIAAGAYDINIVATRFGFRQSPFSKNFPITGNNVNTQVFSSLTLDNLSFTPNGISNVPVGNVVIIMSPTTPASTATITLGGVDAGSFVLTNSGQYPCAVQAKPNIGPGTYHLTLTATQAGISNSPFTSAVLTITGSSASLVTTRTVVNNSGAIISAGSFAPMFGLQFRKGDIPTWPKITASDGTVWPCTFSNVNRWSDGSLKACGVLPGPLPISIGTIPVGGSITINISTGGSTPAVSGFTNPQLFSEGLAVNIVGYGNLSGTWSALLNGDAKTLETIVMGDGPGGRVVRVLHQFQSGGTAHEALVAYTYVQELRNLDGSKAGYRILPRTSQPWYNSAPVGGRAFYGMDAYSVSWTAGGGGSVNAANNYTPNTITTTGGTYLGGSGGTAAHTATTNNWWTGQGRFDGQAPEAGAISGRFTSASGSFNTSSVNFVIAESNGSGAPGTDLFFFGSVSGSGTFQPGYVAWDLAGVFGADSLGRYLYAKGSGSQSASIANPNLQVKFDPIYNRKTKFYPPWRNLQGDPTPFSPYPQSNDYPYQWGPWNTGYTAFFLSAGSEHEWIGPLQNPQARHYYNQTATDDLVVRTCGLAISGFQTMLRDRTSFGPLNISANSYTGVGPSVGTQFPRAFFILGNGQLPTGITGTPANNNPLFASSEAGHYPAGGYYAYLTTGEPQYIDLQIESSIGCQVSQYYQNPSTPTFAVAATGVSPWGDNAIRTIGWTIREMAFAAAIMPDQLDLARTATDPYNTSGPTKYIRDNAARQFQYAVDTTNASAYGASVGLWMPRTTITRNWMRGYLMSGFCIGAGPLESSVAMTVLNNQAKWYTHVGNVMGTNGVFVGMFTDDDIQFTSGQMHDGLSGGAVISSDAQWAPRAGAPTGFLGGVSTNGGSPALFSYGNVNTAQYIPQNGDKLVFSQFSGDSGTLNSAPSGLTFGQDYYIRNLVNAGSGRWNFNLATSGGSLIGLGGSFGIGDDSVGLVPLPGSGTNGIPATSLWGAFQFTAASNLNEIGSVLGWMQALGVTSNLATILADRDARLPQSATLFVNNSPDGSPKWAIGSSF